MSKITVVTQGQSIFNRPWLLDIASEYFTVVRYSDAVTYNNKSTVFYVDTCDVNNTLVSEFLDQRIKVICDSTWEMPTDFLAGKINNTADVYVLSNPNWFWYNESLWLESLGLHTFTADLNYNKLALMPLRLHRPHRAALLSKVDSYLNDMIWSCAWKGKLLDGGGDPLSDWSKQRALVPQWYNDTCFSLVSESQVTKNNNSIFVTEKTFKPIAFGHPYIVWGQPGVLAYLQSQGFETFDELFDESYDSIENNDLRLDAVVKNVAQFKKTTYSKITLDKLQHNHNLYFNKSLVKQRIIDEIFVPLIEYVNQA